MSARENILNRLAGQESMPVDEPDSPQGFEFGKDPEADLCDIFCQTARAQGIGIYMAKRPEVVGDCLKKILGPDFSGKNTCAARCLDPLLYSAFKDLYFGTNDGQFVTGISRATAAVAQTGALVLAETLDNPSAVAFLSLSHVFILEASDIRACMTDVLDMPRARSHALHCIAGPSSTADIGGKLLIGVHGPARVNCIVIGR